MWEALFFAVALSIDAFSVGIVYGLKNIKIPLRSILVINIMAAVVLGLSMSVGHIIKQYISPTIATTISCLTLICLGTFFIIEGYIKHLVETKEDDDNKLIKIRIPRLGVIIEIASDFTKADMDVSGDIDVREAIYLGITLAIDSFAAGFGIALIEVNYMLFISIVFIVSILSIVSGLYFGSRASKIKLGLKASLLPGFILLFMGILRGI